MKSMSVLLWAASCTFVTANIANAGVIYAINNYLQTSPTVTIKNDLYAINPDTAQATFLGTPSNVGHFGLGYDTNFQRLVTNDFGHNKFIAIDPSTATKSVLQVTAGTNFISMAFDPHNNFFYARTFDAGNPLVTIDPLTGAVLSTIGNTNLNSLDSLAYDWNSHVLYGLNAANNQLHLVSIDTNTAEVTDIFLLDSRLKFLTIDPVNHRLFSLKSSTTLVAIDPITGTTTDIGAISFGNVTGFVYAVPETSSFSLGGLVLLGAILYRRITFPLR